MAVSNTDPVGPFHDPVIRPAPAEAPAQDLTQGPITRTLLLFSLPVLGTNALQSLNGSVNQFWVSHSLGVTAITAIGNANIIMMLLVGTIFGVGMAANILIGQSVGARDTTSVKRVMGTSITFFATLAVAVAAIGYPLSPHILAMMDTPADSLAEADTYLRIVFLAMPFLYFFAFLQMAQRGVGDSRTPFYFMLLAVVLDMVLNPILIRGLGPLPALGIAGSALSTLIGQGTSLVCPILMLYRRGSPLMLRSGELRLLRPDGAIIRTLLLRGLPMGLQMLVMSGAAIVMIRYVNSYGAVTAAAFTAASQVWTYIQMPAMALGAAISSMAAQNIGAGRWDRVGRIAWSGVISGLAITGGVTALIYALGDLTLHIFLPPRSVALPVARHINDTVLWGFVLLSVMFALSGIVRATGTVWPPLLILIVSMFAIRIPFAEVLTPHYGADAVWWSFPLGTITASALTALYYRSAIGARPGSLPPTGRTGRRRTLAWRHRRWPTNHERRLYGRIEAEDVPLIRVLVIRTDILCRTRATRNERRRTRGCGQHGEAEVMIELYHCVDARSFRALWALEELGLEYRLHLLPFPPRVERPDYLEANPLGTIPLLIDGDVRMTESGAIPQYLATRYGPTPLAVGVDEPDYGLWLDWLHRSEATLTFPQTIVLRYTKFEPEPRRLQQAADDYAQWFLSRLRHVTRALSDREWLCAGRFTMADLCVGYALLLARTLGLEHKFSPEVADYWTRLSSRPGFLAAKVAQGEGVKAAWS